MKCPVPGCTNPSFRENQLFCPSCGLLGGDIDKVESLMTYWNDLYRNPLDFCEYATSIASPFLSPLFQMAAEYEAKRPTVADIEAETGVSAAQFGVSSSDTLTAISVLGDHCSSVKSFRIAHPDIRFFRCWFCDLYDEFDRGPLLPPSKYAHSTLDDNLMMGMRPDYTIHTKLKHQRDRLQAVAVPRPERSYANVNRMSRDMAGFRGVGNEYQAQLADWQRAAHQADDAENARREQDYYRALEDQRREVADLERQMGQHQPRPDARSHQTCPNCNAPFPFVLREINDTRYMQRHEGNFNEPMTGVERHLYGPDISLNEASRLSYENPAEFRSKSMGYYIRCGAKASIVSMLQAEQTFGSIDWASSFPT